MSCDLTSSLCYTAGRIAEMRFAVTDQDNVVVDISSGYSVAFALARRFGGTVVVGTEVSPATASYTITDGPNGIFKVTILSVDNASLLGTYAYEAVVTNFEGTPFTVGRGFVTFEKGVV